MLLHHQSNLFQFGQWAAMLAVGVSAFSLAVTTCLSAFGVLPWLELTARFGSTDVGSAGMILQIGVTALLLLIASFIPSNIRVLRLEAAHSEFRIGMRDVRTAYELAHAHDRADTFKMHGEFDGIRERFEFLRDHSDLEELDGELLTIAAQMSHQSRDLARVYSDDKVARVRDALVQRRVDADLLHERIQTAHATIREVRRALDDVEIEEASVGSQMQRLWDEVTELATLSGQGGLKGANSAKVPRLHSVKNKAAAAD